MSEEISIRVKSMDDRVETIAIKLTDMVSILREKVHTKFDIPMEEITLLFRGRVLKDDQTVQSYKVERDNTILLVRRRRQENGRPITVLHNKMPEQQRQNQLTSAVAFHMTELSTLCDQLHASRERLQAASQDSEDTLSSEAREKLKQATQILQTVQTESQTVADWLLRRLQSNSTSPALSTPQLEALRGYLSDYSKFMSSYSGALHLLAADHSLPQADIPLPSHFPAGHSDDPDSMQLVVQMSMSGGPADGADQGYMQDLTERMVNSLIQTIRESSPPSRAASNSTSQPASQFRA
ncbi:hypothetical protein WA577_001430 [Blastocystis sp. JDR]